MVAVLPYEIKSTRAVSGELGRQLLDVMTSGMYSDPRMAIREYIQNAADSIDQARKTGVYVSEQPNISVVLDGRTRTITIEDNGTGLERESIDHRLGSLGCSVKAETDQRGFRGIGRLGGVAYCDTVRFETRQDAKELVSVVEWSGKSLRDKVPHAGERESLSEAVKRTAIKWEREANGDCDPARFFRVQMINVHQFHSDLLMNVKGLRDYLSQTAPVAFQKPAFSFAHNIEEHLRPVPGYRVYNISVNNAQVLRPYQMDVIARENATDQIRDIEYVECRSRHGHLICKGWFAHTQFLSALPPSLAMRGVRVRQGNIAVGDEYYLKGFFGEDRFATWHIGELHMTSALKLNARRDGFEESEEHEDFLEWVALFCQRLGGLCRQHSKRRSIKKNAMRLQSEIDRKLALPLFVDDKHYEVVVRSIEQDLFRLRNLLSTPDTDEKRMMDSFSMRLGKIQKSPVFLEKALDGRSFRGKSPRQMIVDISKRALSNNPSSSSYSQLLEMLKPYLRGALK
jgi:Histidine kinase-, DNA gyrase B-, and HSP90-like ATPase